MSPSPLIYVECEIPEGMTIREWRRRRTATPRRHHGLRAGWRRRRASRAARPTLARG